MSRLTTIPRACALVAALVAGWAQVAAASAPPASEPAGSAPPDADFVLPDGWTTLVDDTNTITVATPATWVDVDTAPRSNTDGTLMPSIVAATNIDTFIDTFDEPGVLYRAIAYDADQQGVMDRFGLTGGCQQDTVEPYDDGAFVGLHGIWTDCGPTSAPEWHQIVAAPASQSFTVVLQIQITGAGQADVIDNVLASFNFTPQGGSTPGPFPPPTNPGETTTTAPDGTTTTTTTTATTTLSETTTTAPGPTTVPLPTVSILSPPSGSIPADSQQLVDDQGVLSIHVPPSWTDTSTGSYTGQGLVNAPYISATPNSELFFPDEDEADTWSVPGVYYVALPFSSDVSEVMADRGDLRGCEPQGVESYSDGAFTGLIRESTGCGGSPTRVVVVVANPPDGSLTILLVLQLTGSTDDDAIYQTILSSFNVIDSAS